jgi:hypothetical protein
MESISPTKKCTKPWCKNTVPSQSSQKHCSDCQERDRENQKALCARKKSKQALAGQKHTQEHGPESGERPAQHVRAKNGDGGRISEEVDRNKHGSDSELEDEGDTAVSSQ